MDPSGKSSHSFDLPATSFNNPKKRTCTRIGSSVPVREFPREEKTTPFATKRARRITKEKARNSLRAPLCLLWLSAFVLDKSRPEKKTANPPKRLAALPTTKDQRLPLKTDDCLIPAVRSAPSPALPHPVSLPLERTAEPGPEPPRCSSRSERSDSRVVRG